MAKDAYMLWGMNFFEWKSQIAIFQFNQKCMVQIAKKKNNYNEFSGKIVKPLKRSIVMHFAIEITEQLISLSVAIESFVIQELR